MIRQSTYNLLGQRFGALVLKEIIGEVKGQGAIGRFQCDCGKTKDSVIAKIKHRPNASCGCRMQCLKGNRETREYKIWVGMRHRCRCSTYPQYHRYGGRGVSVCPEWENSFERFYEDMGPSPSPNHSINRKWIDGVESMVYSKDTCEWATQDKQVAERGCNWTEEEDNLLRQFVRDGMSSNEIISVFPPSRDGKRRTFESIRSRRKTIGLSRKKKMTPKWSPEEDELLKSLVSMKVSGPEIVRIFEETSFCYARTMSSISNRRERLGLTKKRA